MRRHHNLLPILLAAILAWWLVLSAVKLAAWILGGAS